MAAACSSWASSSSWSMTSLKSALPSSSSTHFVQMPYRLPFASPSPSRLSLSLSKPNSLRSFVGLAPLHPLLTSSSEELNSFDHGFTVIDNGGRIFATRHGKRVPKLNRSPDQRRALLRRLTTQLLKHGRIKTTRARASAVRKFVDKMVTLAKDGSLHKRRQPLGFIYEKEIVHALFAEVEGRYGDRQGGYTRIIQTLPTRGDNAPMAYIELV